MAGDKEYTPLGAHKRVVIQLPLQPLAVFCTYAFHSTRHAHKCPSCILLLYITNKCAPHTHTCTYTHAHTRAHTHTHTHTHTCTHTHPHTHVHTYTHTSHGYCTTDGSPFEIAELIAMPRAPFMSAVHIFVDVARIILGVPISKRQEGNSKCYHKTECNWQVDIYPS